MANMKKQTSAPTTFEKAVPLDFESVFENICSIDNAASDAISAIQELLNPPRFAEGDGRLNLAVVTPNQNHFLRRTESLLVDFRHAIMGLEQDASQRSDGSFLAELAKRHAGGFRSHG
jgi:hypothetical protein